MHNVFIIRNLFFGKYVTKPHIIVDGVWDVDYQNLRKRGVKYVVFDKDNTLTKHLDRNWFSKDVELAVLDCKRLFGE